MCRVLASDLVNVDMKLKIERNARGAPFCVITLPGSILVELFSMLVAILVELRLMPGLGKLVFFATAITAFIIWSALPTLRQMPVLILVLVFTLLNILAVLMLPSIEPVPAGVFVPIVLLEYILFGLIYESVSAPVRRKGV